MTTGNPKGGTARILIVDDHPVVRLGLSQLLASEPDLEIAAEAESAAGALDAVERERPDLVIVDISLGDGSGLELIKRLKGRDPDLKMLVSSVHDESLFAQRALKAGAMGYIGKDEAPERIVEAVRRILGGGIFLSRKMTDRMLQAAAAGRDPAAETAVDALSDRELEVFELIGRALTTREIAERLHLSVKTVETYRENVKAKLQLANNNELIRRAVEWTLRQT